VYPRGARGADQEAQGFQAPEPHEHKHQLELKHRDGAQGYQWDKASVGMGNASALAGLPGGDMLLPSMGAGMGMGVGAPDLKSLLGEGDPLSLGVWVSAAWGVPAPWGSLGVYRLRDWAKSRAIPAPWRSASSTSGPPTAHRANGRGRGQGRCWGRCWGRGRGRGQGRGWGSGRGRNLGQAGAAAAGSLVAVWPRDSGP